MCMGSGDEEVLTGPPFHDVEYFKAAKRNYKRNNLVQVQVIGMQSKGKISQRTAIITMPTETLMWPVLMAARVCPPTIELMAQKPMNGIMFNSVGRRTPKYPNLNRIS